MFYDPNSPPVDNYYYHNHYLHNTSENVYILWDYPRLYQVSRKFSKEEYLHDCMLLARVFYTLDTFLLQNQQRQITEDTKEVFKVHMWN